MVIQWSFDRYQVPRVLRSENPKLKLTAKTEGSDSPFDVGRSMFDVRCSWPSRWGTNFKYLWL